MPDNQREIYLILIERNDKNIDRFFSLIELDLMIVTLYAAIAVYHMPDLLGYLNGFDPYKADFGTTLHYLFVAYSLLSLLLACVYSYMHLHQVKEKSMEPFKTENDLIQFKTDQELTKLNKELFSMTRLQSTHYLGSISLSIFSIGSALVYLLVSRKINYGT